MFGLRLDMSVDQFIIEYTEYLLGKKEEKFHYLTENYVDYIGNYVYPIIQETASWIADAASFAFNKVVYPVFESDTLFNIIGASSDFLGEFSKVQLACIAVLAFLFFGLNKTIRTSRKLKKDLKTYQSMLNHVNWQYEAAKPEMKEIIDRLNKNRDEKIPQANKQLEKIYTLIDKKYRIQQQLENEDTFWRPLIMEEVRKLHHYNAVWEHGGDSEGIKKVRELGRHVDIEIAKIRNKVEILKKSLEERKQASTNLRFDEMPQDALGEVSQPPRCDTADVAQPVFFLAHGDAEDKPLDKEGNGDNEDSWGDMHFSTLSWAEQVEKAERQELKEKISCEEESDVVEDGGAKNEDGGDLWNIHFSSLSWAEQVEEAERLELGEQISREEETDVVEDVRARKEDGGDQWDDIHFSSLSWAEQVDEAESLGYKFSCLMSHYHS